jgi:DNA-binding response OmpR family regulator
MEKTRILVVDDEPEICEVTRNFLAKRDYEVFTAGNVQEAVSSVKRDKPQLILLDVRLGSESGMDVLRQAKEIDKEIKIIMVTALDDEETIRQAKALGADDYIAKPFTAGFLDDFVMQKISRLGLGKAAGGEGNAKKNR